MTTKEKIIRQAIDQVQKKVVATKELLSANPLGRICEIRIEANKILQQHGDDYATIARLLKPLGEEEKRMFSLAEKQKNSMALIDKQVELEHELYELGCELYLINRGRERHG
jgi:hypothetical protein